MDAVNLFPAGEKAIELKDGRTLGYADLGSPDGPALFYFHGHPGCRFEAGFLTEPARQKHIRLIGVDRPGLGLSTYQPGRQFLDWPDDVVELADRLGVGPFAVVGFSGGGPYAAACAYKIPQRLTACGIVAGVGDLSPLLSFLSQWLPWLILPLSRRLFKDEAQAQKTLGQAARNWVEPDRVSLGVPGIRQVMSASLVEALRPGARGAAYDGALLGRRWGFKAEDIQLRNIYLWHGELDNEVPISAGKALAKKIRRCKATYYPNEGHISLIVNHAQEIVMALSS